MCALLAVWGCSSSNPAAPKKTTPTEGDVTVIASADNTIYNDPDTYSNGAGVYMVVGQTNTVGGGVRRGLVKFDLSTAVPAGSTIDSVIVQLHMSRTKVVSKEIRMHKLLESWGEAGSDAGVGPGNGGAGQGPGIGAPAEIGDATWLYRMYDTVAWSTPGGNYASTGSAIADVNDVGNYRWTSTKLKEDVQGWIDDPSSNHGWILIGIEGETSAKRFDTRENATEAARPKLIIWYTAP